MSKWFFILELLSYVDDHIFGGFWGKTNKWKNRLGSKMPSALVVDIKEHVIKCHGVAYWCAQPVFR